eukprot:Unigene1685_Nuclearia_a/m.5192 Unigene1685_Nuclearia_a/g.5192  ORF Unigene1685_Nuclearia_a/g.5192 Unigene1685_Nuclearia_a/m.5192 type:complete len:138 (-) Unigene1685_Nuclearia_a:71-484(-)
MSAAATVALNAFILTRGATGVVALVSPSTISTIAGLDAVPASDKRMVLLTRLFGARDLVLAGSLFVVPYLAGASSTAAALQLPVMRTALQMGLIVDSIDVVSVLVGTLGPHALSTYTALFTGGGAAVFAAIAYSLLQ